VFVFHFCWGGISLPMGYTGLCSWGWRVESHVMRDAYLFCQLKCR
jgi:hypothetical protein